MRTLIVIVGMSILGLLFGCKTHQPSSGDNSGMLSAMPEGKLTEVSYGYMAMMLPTVGNPTITRGEDGKATLTFNHYNEERTFEVSDTLFDEARKIIEEEEMYKYASDYTAQFNDMILDGYSWHFSAKFESGEAISTGGSNARPSGNGLHRIDSLLTDVAMKCLKEAGEQVE
jgi:hypothetical protein